VKKNREQLTKTREVWAYGIWNLNAATAGPGNSPFQKGLKGVGPPPRGPLLSKIVLRVDLEGTLLRRNSKTTPRRCTATQKNASHGKTRNKSKSDESFKNNTKDPKSSKKVPLHNPILDRSHHSNWGGNPKGPEKSDSSTAHQRGETSQFNWRWCPIQRVPDESAGKKAQGGK